LPFVRSRKDRAVVNSQCLAGKGLKLFVLSAALLGVGGLFSAGARGESPVPVTGTPKTTASATSSPDGKTFVQRIPGTDVTFEMVQVPAGTFKMGSPSSEADRKPDEGPQVEVEVDPFYIGSHEVTWGEYNKFLQNYHRIAGLDPTKRPAIPANKLADAVTYPTPMYELEAGPILDRMGRGDKFPAVIMSQFAAKQYCKWLSKKTGRFYRLPTEAEWEYACRAGTTTPYNTGADEAALKDAGWFFDNSEKDDGDGAYREVGKKKPNAWGLYDMHGNVAEWTLDAYAPDWYQKFAGKKAKASELVNWPKQQYGRVVRGGGWESEKEDCRSARRIVSEKDWNQKDPQLPKSPHWITEGFWIGFRVVSPVKEPSDEEKHKYWDVDDEVTGETLKQREERQMRELVEAEPVAGPAPTGAASAAGASAGK
jgi:formylglycine-generating enzyme required for sulfatase activity